MNASGMDDMLFECNKNAIYVLNSNYAYGEFGRLNLFGASTATGNLSNGSASNRQKNGVAAVPPSSSYSSSAIATSTFPSLYRSSSTSLVSNLTTEVPYIASKQKHPTATGTTTTTTTSATMATTIPTFFQYSHSQHQPLDELPQFSQHETCHPQQLLEQRQQHQHQSQQQQYYDFPAKCKTNATNSSSTSSLSVAPSSKKSSYIKSAIIAKKTKFWKYLEEEQWKKTTENLTATDLEPNSDKNLMKNNSSTISSNRSSFMNNNNNQNNNNAISNNGGRNKGTNAGDSSQKSSSELYKEAAELLGLSCTLCDNCRCLDCQSRYFDFDDSDSYSELSFLDDYIDSFDSNQSTKEAISTAIYSQLFTNPDECRSRQSDSYSVCSVCSVNSNHSDSPRDLSYDD